MSVKSLFAIVVLCGTAFGQAKPIHVDFTQVLVSYDGKPIMGGDPKAPTKLTLGEAACQALAATLDSDKMDDWSVKVKRGDLLKKIYVNGQVQKDVVLSPEEQTVLRDRIGKAWPTTVVIAAIPLVYPPETK